MPVPDNDWIERKAKALILKWCRAELGRVMRSGVLDQPKCRVVDVNISEPVPGSQWKRRAIVYAEADTWLEAAQILSDSGVTDDWKDERED